MATNLMVLILLLGSNSATELSKKSIDIVLILSDKLVFKECVFINCGGASAIKELSKAKIYSIIMSGWKFEQLHANISSSFSTRILAVEIATQERSYLTKMSSPFLFQRLIIDESKGIQEEKIQSGSEMAPIHLAEPNENGFQLHEVFKRKSVHKEICLWKNLNPSAKDKDEEKDTRFNFEKASIAVTMLPSHECSGSIDHLCNKGICFHEEIIKTTAARYNITITNTECLECVDNNRKRFEMFVKGKVDLSSHCNTVNPTVKGDNENISFIFPTIPVKILMYIKKPNFRDNWNSYIQPFEHQTWYAIAATIGLSGWIFALLHRIHFKFYPKNRNVYLSDYFLEAFGIFCNQAGAGFSDSISSRVYRFAVLLLSFILYSVYNGALYFALAFYEPGLPFTDLNGYFSSGNYKIIHERRSYMNKYLQSGDFIPPNNARREDFVVDSQEVPNSTQEAIDRVCQNNRLTFVGWKTRIITLNRLECEIVEMPFKFMSYYWGIGIYAYSPYREYFNRELTNLRSNGILHRLNYQFGIASYGRLPGIKNEGFSVDIFTCSPILAAFCFGILASLCVFLGEVLTKNHFYWIKTIWKLYSGQKEKLSRNSSAFSYQIST